MSTANDGWPEDEAETDAFSMDGGDMSADDAEGEGKTFVDKPGWYHFEVSDVVAKLSRVGKKGGQATPSIEFYLTVLESVNGQSPAKMRLIHSIYLEKSASDGGGKPSPDSVRNSLNFGLALGVVVGRSIDGKNAIVDAVTGERGITTETWLRAKESQCISCVKIEKSDVYGDRAKIKFAGSYKPGSPQVQDVPTNKEAWKLASNYAPLPAQPKDTAKPAPSKPAAVAEPESVDPVDREPGL
jgi:hypothetical protein